MELEKRREKYSIFANSANNKNSQNVKLLKSIDDKLSNADRRRNENIERMEHRFSLRREFQKLK